MSLVVPGLGVTRPLPGRGVLPWLPTLAPPPPPPPRSGAGPRVVFATPPVPSGEGAAFLDFVYGLAGLERGTGTLRPTQSLGTLTWLAPQPIGALPTSVFGLDERWAYVTWGDLSDLLLRDQPFGPVVQRESPTVPTPSELAELRRLTTPTLIESLGFLELAGQGESRRAVAIYREIQWRQNAAERLADVGRVPTDAEAAATQEQLGLPVGSSQNDDLWAALAYAYRVYSAAAQVGAGGVSAVLPTELADPVFG